MSNHTLVQNRIIEYLDKHPKTDLTTLSKKLKLPKSTITFAMSKLRDILIKEVEQKYSVGRPKVLWSIKEANDEVHGVNNKS